MHKRRAPARPLHAPTLAALRCSRVVHARLLSARGFLYLITQELESSSSSGSGGSGGFDANEAGPSQVLGLLPAVVLPDTGWLCMAAAGSACRAGLQSLAEHLSVALQPHLLPPLSCCCRLLLSHRLPQATLSQLGSLTGRGTGGATLLHEVLSFLRRCLTQVQRCSLAGAGRARWAGWLLRGATAAGLGAGRSSSNALSAEPLTFLIDACNAMRHTCVDSPCSNPRCGGRCTMACLCCWRPTPQCRWVGRG